MLLLLVIVGRGLANQQKLSNAAGFLRSGWGGADGLQDDQNGHRKRARWARAYDWSVSQPSRYVLVICILSEWFALESARMAADIPGATQDYSTRPPATRPARAPGIRSRPPAAIAFAARAVLALVALAGMLLLVVSTFSTVVEIRVLTTSDLVGQDTQISGRDLHGIALLLVAGIAALMLLGALRGARPAALALAATGLVALGLIAGLDVPELDDPGRVALLYEDVSAGPAAGLYYEALGGAALLLAGGGLFALNGGRARRGS